MYQIISEDLYRKVVLNVHVRLEDVLSHNGGHRNIPCTKDSSPYFCGAVDNT
jgi:hypothetical protein